MHDGGGLPPCSNWPNYKSHSNTGNVWPALCFNSKVWISSSSVPLICRNGPVTDLDKYKRRTFGTEVCQGSDSSNLCYDNVQVSEPQWKFNWMKNIGDYRRLYTHVWCVSILEMAFKNQNMYSFNILFTFNIHIVETLPHRQFLLWYWLAC